MNNPMNVLPSTSDVWPPIAGGQDDLVLTILENAEKRYRRRGTENAYVDRHGGVCAIGAVTAASGMTFSKWIRARNCFDIRDTSGKDIVAVLAEIEVENDMRQAAKEAIKLLNEAAHKLYPEVLTHSHDYAKPIEALNQDKGFSWRERKKMVLACYSEAKKMRMAHA